MAVQLNTKAVAYAKQLIQQGKVETRGDWASNQPTADEQNTFLDDHSYEEYGNWFLGINTDANPDTKERYEFPYGNFKRLFRSGLIATEQRAGQYKHDAIKKAARELIDMLG